MLTYELVTLTLVCHQRILLSYQAEVEFPEEFAILFKEAQPLKVMIWRNNRGWARMLHTMAALSSGLRCASGSGGSWPCPGVSKPPWLRPDFFSSSEGEWPLSLSTRSEEVVMMNLRPCEIERRMKWDGLKQVREERHDGLCPAFDSFMRYSGSGDRPIVIGDSSLEVCSLSPRLPSPRC